MIRKRPYIGIRKPERRGASYVLLYFSCSLLYLSDHNEVRVAYLDEVAEPPSPILLRARDGIPDQRLLRVGIAIGMEMHVVSMIAEGHEGCCQQPAGGGEGVSDVAWQTVDA